MVCRPSGMKRRIRSTSGRKPRSSISSASSSTSIRTWPRSRWRWLARSMSRPGRADDDVDALAQRLDLRLVGAAAVDGEDADAARRAGGLEVAGDLDAQLAGRDDDERLRLAGVGEVGVGRVLRAGDALQQRDAEAEGLAGAGLGLADDVVAGEGDGERLLLDGEGFGDADGLEGVAGLGEDPEVTEGGQGKRLYSIRELSSAEAGLRLERAPTGLSGSRPRSRVRRRVYRLAVVAPDYAALMSDVSHDPPTTCRRSASTPSTTPATAPPSSTCSACWRTAS